MRDERSIAHFQRIAASTARVNREREREYERLSPFERIALGLTLYRQQLALQQRLLDGDNEPDAKRESFSLRAIYDAARESSAP